MHKLFYEQMGKCKISGIDLIMTPKGNHQTASLDRIDSSKGYTEDNIQWVHKDINWMKNSFKEDVFLKYVDLIYNYRLVNNSGSDNLSLPNQAYSIEGFPI